MSYDFTVNNLDQLDSIRDFKVIEILKNEEFLDYSSPALWNTIFTGIPPSQFVEDDIKRKGHLFDIKWVKHPYIWEIAEKRGVSSACVNACIEFPPMSYNTEFDTTGRGLPIAHEEMVEELNRLLKKGKNLSEYKFVCLNTHVLDAIQHQHEGKEHSKEDYEAVLEMYKKVNRWIGELRTLAEKIVCVSDHGFYHPKYNEPISQTTGPRAFKVHHPNGTLLSTTDVDITSPTILDTFNMILDVLKVIE